MAWSQNHEERGTLPVGRVVAIERRYGPPAMVAKEPNGLKKMGQGAASMVIPPLVLITAPVVLLGHYLGVVELDSNSNDAEKKDGNVYRHVVRLNGTNEEIFLDEYWTYKIGDCVAIRSIPVMLVPALANQCQ